MERSQGRWPADALRVELVDWMDGRRRWDLELPERQYRAVLRILDGTHRWVSLRIADELLVAIDRPEALQWVCPVDDVAEPAAA